MISRPDISKLKAKAGEPVTARKWNALVDFIERLLNALGAMVGRNLHVDEEAGGFHLWAEDFAPRFVGAFYVTLTARGVMVGHGTVNGDLVPRIAGQRIDGSDSRSGTAFPELSLKGAQPNDEMRSWIVLQVTPNAQAQPVAIDPDNEEALVILHTADLSAAPEGSAWLPLAVLEWSDRKTPVRPWQIVYFHQRYSVEQNATTGALKHTFKPAA